MAVVYVAVWIGVIWMKRIFVRSSSINGVGYDPKTRTLEVKFNNGGVYHYFNVPSAIYRALLNAESKGRFVNFKIKGNYPYQQI